MNKPNILEKLYSEAVQLSETQEKHFPRYANKESGFLILATRERIAWTKDEGQALKIRRQQIKDAFLNILDAVQNNTVDAQEVLNLLSLQYKQIFDDALNASDYTSILNIAASDKHDYGDIEV
ncbi:MAG: hypothetical protein LBJ41_04290 [Treponema sp.]|jgi:hypothetical protein|nr:hypothetical protein [Treponema sp.]